MICNIGNENALKLTCNLFGIKYNYLLNKLQVNRNTKKIFKKYVFTKELIDNYWYFTVTDKKDGNIILKYSYERLV